MSNFVIGEMILHDAAGNVISVTTNGELKAEIIQRADTVLNNVLVDPTDNSFKAAVTEDGRLKVESTFNSSGSDATNVVITDPVYTDRQAYVDASGNLKVVTPTPSTPASATAANVTVYNDVSTVSDNNYVIPNGETLTISRMISGSEGTNSGSVCILYYDEDGTGTTLVPLTVQFHNGGNASSDLDVAIDGDGTKRIILRREAFGGGSRQVFAQWFGYTEATS